MWKKYAQYVISLSAKLNGTPNSTTSALEHCRRSSLGAWSAANPNLCHPEKGNGPPNLHSSRRRALRAAAELARVCQAGHRTSEGKVLAPGDCGAEGEEKGKGVTARWGLEEAQSKRAGRRTGIPPKRDGGPPGTSPATGGMTVKSSIRTGVCCINPAPTRQTFCALPWEICQPSGGAD